MDAVDLARRVASSRSRAASMKVLREAHALGHTSFFEIAHLALDPTFVPAQSVPRIEEDDGTKPTFNDRDFIALLSQPTRHADEIREAALAADAETWNTLYRQLLLADHSVISSPSMINEVLGEGHVHSVPLPLFQYAIQTRSLPRGYVWMADALVRGDRFLCIPRKDGSPVVVWEHEKPKGNVDALLEACRRLYRDLPGPLVLDGVVTASERMFYLIDALPTVVYPSLPCQVALTTRHEILCALQMSGALRRVGDFAVLPKVEVDLGTPEGRERVSVLRNEAVAAGHAGLVLKDPTSAYVGGASKQWRAMKGAA